MFFELLKREKKNNNRTKGVSRAPLFEHFEGFIFENFDHKLYFYHHAMFTMCIVFSNLTTKT